MNEMKSKAIEKLMMVLDEVLGEDVVSRLKSKVDEKTGMGEEEKEEYSEEEDKEEEKPEIELEMPEGMGEKKQMGKPEGVGIEVQDVKVAALPKPGLMKKMRGLK